MAKKKNKFDQWDTAVIIMMLVSLLALASKRSVDDLVASIAEAVFFASFFGYIVSKVIARA
jgi:hypothetical protein